MDRKNYSEEFVLNSNEPQEQKAKTHNFQSSVADKLKKIVTDNITDNQSVEYLSTRNSPTQEERDAQATEFRKELYDFEMGYFPEVHPEFDEAVEFNEAAPLFSQQQHEKTETKERVDSIEDATAKNDILWSQLHHGFNELSLKQKESKAEVQNSIKRDVVNYHNDELKNLLDMLNKIVESIDERYAYLKNILKENKSMPDHPAYRAVIEDIDALASEWNLIDNFKVLVIDQIQQIKDSAVSDFADSVSVEREFHNSFNNALQETKKAIQAFINQRNEFADLYRNIELEIGEINTNFVNNHRIIDQLVSQLGDEPSYNYHDPQIIYNYQHVSSEVKRLNGVNNSLSERKELLESKLLDAKQKVDRSKKLVNEKKELLDSTVNSYKENVANYLLKFQSYLVNLNELSSDLKNPTSLIAERYHAAHSYLEARDIEIVNTISSLSWDLGLDEGQNLVGLDTSIEDLRRERYRLSLEMEVLDIIVATASNLIDKVNYEIQENIKKIDEYTANIEQLIADEETDINEWILRTQNDVNVSLNFPPLKPNLLSQNLQPKLDNYLGVKKNGNSKLKEEDLYTRNINDAFNRQTQTISDASVNFNTNITNTTVDLDKQNHSLMRFFNDKESEIDKLSFKISQNLFEKNPIDKILDNKRNEAKKYLKELKEIKELLRDQKEILIKNGQINLTNLEMLNTRLAKSTVDVEINKLVPETANEDFYELVADFKRKLRKEQIALESDLQINYDHAKHDLEDVKEFVQSVNDDQNTIDNSVENLINNRMAEFHKQNYDAITSPLCETVTNEWKICKDDLFKLQEKRIRLNNRLNTIHDGIERYIKRLLDQKSDIANLQLINGLTNGSIEKRFEINWNNDNFADLAKKIEDLSNRYQVLNEKLQKLNFDTNSNNSAVVDVTAQVNRIKNEIAVISENRKEISEFCFLLLKSLNQLFDQLLNLKREVESLIDNHNLQKQKHDESINRSFHFINNEINRYYSERQRNFEQVKLQHDRLVDDENTLDRQAKELAHQFNAIKRTRNTTKELNPDQRLELEQIRNEQRALLEEKERIQAEREALLLKVRNYENSLRSSQTNSKQYQSRINELLKENNKLKKNFASQNKKIQEVIQELINRSQYLDESQHNQLFNLQSKYQELKRFDAANRKMRSELEKSYDDYTRAIEASNSDLSNDNLTNQRHLNARANHLEKQWRELKLRESKFENYQQNLMRLALKMRLDLDRYNQLIFNHDPNLIETELNQRLRDHEIRSLLRKLNESSDTLNENQITELIKIKSDHQKLEAQQTQLNDKIKIVNDKIAQIQLLRSDRNNPNAQQLNHEYDYLINQRNVFNTSLVDLENLRSNLVDRLHRLENYVEIKRQKEQIKNQHQNPTTIDERYNLNETEFGYNMKHHEYEPKPKSRNTKYSTFNEAEINLDTKITELNQKAKSMKKKIANSQMRLRDEVNQCNELKQVIAQEQIRLDEAKTRAIERLKNYHNELDQKKSKLKSLYEKIKFVRNEQTERQKKLDDATAKYDSDVKSLEKVKDKIKKKEADFRIRRRNEIHRIKGIYQVLLNRQAELDKIKSELKTEKTQLEEISKHKLHHNAHTNGCKNNQSHCEVRSNLGVVKMNKHFPNNNINMESPCACESSRTVIPYNDLVYQPHGLNQVIQIQQLLQHQQIQMLNQEHRMKLEEANRRRQESENKLQEVLRWQERARDFRRYYAPVVEQECTMGPRIVRHGHSNNNVSKETVQEMLKRFAEKFAEKTKDQLTEMKQSINELKQTTIQNQNQAHQEMQSIAYPNYVRDEYVNDTLNRQRDELASIEKRNMRILDEIKHMVGMQREAFNRERQLLVDEFRRRNELRNRALDEKEKNFKNILNQMVDNFNHEISTIRRDKQNLATKLQETRDASYKTRLEANNEALQTKSLLETTHKILADERESFARQREALMQEILATNKQQPKEVASTGTENQNKKNTISRLSEQIKNVKEMLNK